MLKLSKRKRKLKRYLVADEICKALRSAIAKGQYGGFYKPSWDMAIDLLIYRWMQLAGKEAGQPPKRRIKMK
jgi:hypothetical protein